MLDALALRQDPCSLQSSKQKGILNLEIPYDSLRPASLFSAVASHVCADAIHGCKLAESRMTCNAMECGEKCRRSTRTICKVGVC